MNISDRGNCVFHITLDWLGKSLVNHQNTLWLSTGRVERLVLPIASVRGIKLLPTGSKCDRWFVQSPPKILFLLKQLWLHNLWMSSFFFFWLDLFMNCIYLERLCSKQAPGSFNNRNFRVTLHFICYQKSVWEIMIFLFSAFIGPGKRGCDKVLTNTVSFLGLIKTSAWLLSLIAPLGDPWVASTSTLRLKWMFTSPNDYLSQCWVNASALSAAKVTHTHTETRPQTSVPVEP